VLSGLKTHLMTPELAKEFAAEYHRELNRLNAVRAGKHEQASAELDRIQRQITAIIEAIAERLELDTRRVTFDFDSESAEDRERIARVYRHARVVSHVTSDGRVAIEADVPRRVLERVRAAGPLR